MNSPRIRALALSSVCICMLLAPRTTLADKSDAETAMLAFQDAFGRIAKDEGAALPKYERLQSLYDRLDGVDKKQAAQLLSMADAMFGRYRDAEEHYYAAFSNGREPAACPVSGMSPQPALEQLGKLASGVRVVLINESHSMVVTRAFVYRFLPTLRALGFKYLAMEALAPASDVLVQSPPMKILQDTALSERGYPLDKSAAGFYLREPLYAEIVREALAQGFTLVAYETLQAKSRDEREEKQAMALAKLIKADPEAKIAVIAGYSHIWKADGWMADRLQKQVGKLLSIDQTSGLWGCRSAISTGSVEPYILVDKNGKGWATKSDRVDVTVLYHPAVSGRSAPSGWLTLGGSRKSVRPDTAACADAWPCLVSALYATEADGAVPADRILLEDADDKAMLFLKPGSYRYVIEPHGGSKVQRKLTIP